jgi:hypothetical protein
MPPVSASRRSICRGLITVISAATPGVIIGLPPPDFRFRLGMADALSYAEIPAKTRNLKSEIRNPLRP